MSPGEFKSFFIEYFEERINFTGGAANVVIYGDVVDHMLYYLENVDPKNRKMFMEFIDSITPKDMDRNDFKTVIKSLYRMKPSNYAKFKETIDSLFDPSTMKGGDKASIISFIADKDPRNWELFVKKVKDNNIKDIRKMRTLSSSYKSFPVPVSQQDQKKASSVAVTTPEAMVAVATLPATRPEIINIDKFLNSIKGIAPENREKFNKFVYSLFTKDMDNRLGVIDSVRMLKPSDYAKFKETIDSLFDPSTMKGGNKAFMISFVANMDPRNWEAFVKNVKDNNIKDLWKMDSLSRKYKDFSSSSSSSSSSSAPLPQQDEKKASSVTVATSTATTATPEQEKRDLTVQPKPGEAPAPASTSSNSSSSAPSSQQDEKSVSSAAVSTSSVAIPSQQSVPEKKEGK
jgi:hypothetical protein